MPTATAKPKLNLDKLHLDSGSHNNPDEGMCVMEAVAFLADESFSDRPACACPVIAAILRRWNDRVGDKERQELKRYILPLVGSKSTAAVESKRAYMAVDWSIRTSLPMFLDVAKLNDHAAKLRALNEVTCREDYYRVRPVVIAALDAAREARSVFYKRYPNANAIAIDIDIANAIDIDIDIAIAKAKKLCAGLTASAHDLIVRMLAVKE